MERSTKQKDIIFSTLKSLKTHPTINELYKEVISRDNNIGQATVYRNINKLCENKKIRKIQVGQSIDHYDGDLSPHYHFICDKCNKIIDIFDNECEKIIEKVIKNYDLEVTNYELIISGLCNECKEVKNEEI